MQPNKFEIKVVEATTHYINIDCIESVTSKAFDLSGYDATFVLKYADERKVYKKTSITDNTVSIKLDPEDTLEQKRVEFESRIFAKENSDVFHVVLGTIKVHPAVDPLIEYKE